MYNIRNVPKDPDVEDSSLKTGNFQRCARQLILAAAAFALLLAASSRAQAWPQKTFMVKMRDGAQLATEVYFPSSYTEGKSYPVLLMRTPYGRKQWGDMLSAFVVPNGFILVSQDTRGRFDSEGFSASFMDDSYDGYETVEWVASQSWCRNKKVGTVGISAMGITQFMMAKEAPPHLNCQLIMAATPSLYDTAYQGGGFKRALVLSWLGGNKFPIEVLQLLHSNVDYGGIWRIMDLTPDYHKVNWPILHMAGWYDMFLGNNLEAFARIREQGGPNAKNSQRLIIGPWTHQGFLGLAGGTKQGELTYPTNAIYDVPKAVSFFKSCMQGKTLNELHSVQYYVMGDVDDPAAPGNEWRSAPHWPVPATYTPWYMHKDKFLSSNKPKDAKADIKFITDPANPVPTIGGANLELKRGPMDQRSIESRDDVIVFSSEPLEKPIEITGPIKAKIFVSADVVDADFAVRLSDVYPDGRSMLLTDGLVRASHRESREYRVPLQPGKIYELDVDMWATSIVFNKGHRIRISVSGTNFPRFDVNMHNGRYFDLQPNELQEAVKNGLKDYYSKPDLADDYKVAHNTLYLGGENASYIMLPVVAVY